jgi:tetratricopeptide (TPR) repeat protein
MRAMNAEAPVAKRWLFGPAPDLLLGCGLLYALFFAVVFAVGDTGAWLPTVLAPLLVLLFSSPHYGATIVRVYEERSERRRYAFFSVWVTAVIAAWFVASQHWAGAGSAMLTLYLTWSPWHYTGQNYGVAVMMLGRRGVALDAATKRWLHLGFVTSFAVFFCVIHESSVWAESRFLPLAAERVRFVPLGTPRDLTAAALAVHGFAVVVSLVHLFRCATARDLLPALALILSQTLWFTLPALALHAGLFAGRQPLGADVQIQVIFWIAVAHSLQYLWVTAYYARSGSRWSGATPYAAKVFAAGTAVWLLPAALFGPDAFGGHADVAALPLMVASAVNLHHFVLDGAIWKLRGPIGRVLIRSESYAPVGEAPPPRTWLRRATWGAAGACAVASLFIYATEHLALPRALAASERARAETMLDALALFGRDSAATRGHLGGLAAAAGNHQAAAAAFSRSIALSPSLEAYGALVATFAKMGDFEEALPWCERMLAFAPDHPRALNLAAAVFLRAGDAPRSHALRQRAAESSVPDESAPNSASRKPAVY